MSDPNERDWGPTWNNISWLHVYGQMSNHSPAEIRGTGKALRDLRDAITLALEKGDAEAQFFVNDGEGYAVRIVRQEIVGLLGGSPYVDDIADERKRFFWKR